MTDTKMRLSPAARRRLIADLEAILQAEPWPVEALPVKVGIARCKWPIHSRTWWTAIKAAGRSGLLGREECIGREFGGNSSGSDSFGKSRVVRRQRAWSNAAGDAGLRRATIAYNAPVSAHQEIAAEALAQAYDREDPSEAAA